MLETLIQQYLAPVVSWLTGLFTAAEWKAFVLLIGVTLSGTHTIKIIWRLGPMRGPTHRHVYLASAGFGFVAAAFLWPAGYSWWIPGVLAGPVAAVAFKLGFYFIKRFAPGLAATLNADRRRRQHSPPGGFERRQ
jgi:hypothetical protein